MAFRKYWRSRLGRSQLPLHLRGCQLSRPMDHLERRGLDSCLCQQSRRLPISNSDSISHHSRSGLPQPSHPPARPLARPEPADVEQALRLVLQLQPGFADGLPLRALPIIGNDTKFFERNERFLLALLDIRFDGEASRQGLEAFLGAYAERGHWLLVIDLDGSLLPFAQLRVRASELSRQSLPGNHLLIVENETCQHQLPHTFGHHSGSGHRFRPRVDGR